MPSLAKATVAPLVLLLAAAIPAAAAHAATHFTAKLWIVPPVASGTFPVPIATPDATFTTSHIAFWMDAPYQNETGAPEPSVNNTVAGFLDSANKVAHLAFSGQTNPAIGGVVNAGTPVVGSTTSTCNAFGTVMEFTGKVKLTQNEVFQVTHDDGASLKIDGALIAGIGSGPGFATTDRVQFTGTTGTHTIDLVYANDCGEGILTFSPAM